MTDAFTIEEADFDPYAAPKPDHCTCEPGRAHDGSEHGPCAYCENLAWEEHEMKTVADLYRELEEAREDYAAAETSEDRQDARGAIHDIMHELFLRGDDA
jgi:hypothetical protein